MQEEIEIGRLYDQLLEEGYEIENNGKYELIRCPGLEVLTYGNRYVKVNALSRHRTSKRLVRITVKSYYNVEMASGDWDLTYDEYDVTVTTDHICMVYNKDHFFENTDAKNLKPGDFVSVYDEYEDIERRGEITRIEDLGTTSEYVYDLEVDDDMHSFYANDILVHNSIFLNLEPLTDHIRKDNPKLGEDITKWPQSFKKDLWKTMQKFVDEDVNAFVRGMVHDFCHTSKQDILTYDLEYMSACGIYERKKHYATRKIFDEGDPVDKIKYSGIEMKKGSLPKFVKKYLQEIYEGVLIKNWGENEYRTYVNALYDKFTTFSIGDIAFWKGYNTEREAAGFLQMAQTVNPTTGKTVGTTGIAKAATYYNQIIEKLGLGKKYEQLRLGDKCRFLYIDENNQYRINVMAYKDGQWPEEFDTLFKPDYRKMFEKTILDALKSFREACKFADTDPSKQVVFDLFDL